jgi:hypothetical protein
MQRKMKLGIVGTLMAVMVASVAYAWVASNTLNFTTNLSGSPFQLDIVDDYTNRNVRTEPYLPPTMYYGEPAVLNTITYNKANAAYSNVKTNYEIWRRDGASMTYDQSNPWLTVRVQDSSGTPDIYLTVAGAGYSNFGLISDTTISANANNALLAYIGPYTAGIGLTKFANVTVTFLNTAASVTYDAKVWVSVG